MYKFLYNEVICSKSESQFFDIEHINEYVIKFLSFYCDNQLMSKTKIFGVLQDIGNFSK